MTSYILSANARLILRIDKVLVRDTYSTASERVCRLSEHTSGRIFQLKKTESIKMWAAFGSHTFLYSPEVKSLFLLEKYVVYLVFFGLACPDETRAWLSIVSKCYVKIG